jgi:hypothetical protein
MKNKNIALIYRENEVYNKYIPQIIEKLEEKGYNVKKISFPVGSSYKQIKEVMDKEKEELQSLEVSCWFDRTTKDNWYYELDREDRPDALRYQIDKAFELAATKAITGELYNHIDRESVESIIESASKPYEEILKSMESPPSEVYVVVDNIADHFHSSGRMSNRDCAELVSSWFYHKESDVQMIRNNELENLVEDKKNNEDVLFVYDRHNYLARKNIEDSSVKCGSLAMPLACSLQSIVKGNLDKWLNPKFIDEEKFKDEIDEALGWFNYF